MKPSAISTILAIEYNDDEIDAMQQDELARQFAQTQQQRYGEQYQHECP